MANVKNRYFVDYASTKNRGSKTTGKNPLVQDKTGPSSGTSPKSDLQTSNDVGMQTLAFPSDSEAGTQPPNNSPPGKPPSNDVGMKTMKFPSDNETGRLPTQQWVLG